MSAWWAWLGEKLGLAGPLPPRSVPAPALLDQLGYDEWHLPLGEAQQIARQVWWLWHERRIDADGVRRVAEDLRQRIDHLTLGEAGRQTFADLLGALREMALRPPPDDSDCRLPPDCLGSDSAGPLHYPPLAEDTEHYSHRPPSSD